MDQQPPSNRSSDRLLTILGDLGAEVMKADDLAVVLQGAASRLLGILPVEGVGAVVDGPWLERRPLVVAAGRLSAEEVLGVHRAADPGCRPGGSPVPGADGRPLWVVPLRSVAGPMGSLVLSLAAPVGETDPFVQLAAAVAGVLATGLHLRFGVGQVPDSPGARRLVLDTMWDPSLLLDPRGTILEVSTPVARILRRNHDELVGTSFLDVVEPGDREIVSGLLAGHGEEGESFEVPFGVLTAGGAPRRFHLHARWTRGGVWLGVLRDYTRHAARDRSRRVLLDHMPRIAVARTTEELWERLWTALGELLPDAHGVRVYRGLQAALRMVWASDLPPGERDLVFTLKGWGARFIGLLGESVETDEVLEAFGQSAEEMRGRIMRFFAGRGNPVILDDPDRQLAAFLSPEELEKLRRFRGVEGDRFCEILCPVIVDENLDLLVVILGRPGTRAFTWDEAADAWQLVNLAREVTVRLEASATIEGHYSMVRAFRSAMRRVSVATRAEELFEAVGQAALDSTGARGMGVVARTGGGPGELEMVWTLGLEGIVPERLIGLVDALERREALESEPVFFPSVGADELLAELGVDLPGVEALAVAPLTVRGCLLGAMVLTWAAPQRFPPDERAQTEFLAGELGLALSNHQLYRAVEASRSELRRIVEAVDEGILSLDRGGKVRFLSGRAAELLGVREKEPEGRSLLDVVDPRVGEEILPILAGILRGEGLAGGTIRRGRRLIQVRVWLDPGEGTSVWTLGEMTTSEERRLQLEEFYTRTEEGIVQLALDGRVVGANPAAQRFLRLIGRGEADDGFRWLPWDEEALRKLERGDSVWISGERPLPSGTRMVWEAEMVLLGGAAEPSVLVRVHDLTVERTLERLRDDLTEARRLAGRLREMVERLREAGASQEDLATAVMMHCSLAGEEAGSSGREGRALGAIRQATANAAEAMGSFRRLLGELEEEVERLGAVLPEGPGDDRGEAWIVSDRPWRRGALASRLRAAGWTVRSVPVAEVRSRWSVNRPRLVVIDLGLLTQAVDLYGVLRASSADLGILMILGMGGGLEGGALAEDPRVRVVDGIPDEGELEAFLAELS